MPFNFNHNQTVVERVQYWAEKQPDAEAFVFIDKDGLRSVLTCKEVCDQAIYFAKQLRRLGLIPGDIVCTMLPNSPNGIIALFGIMFSGCLLWGNSLQLSDASILIQDLNKAKCRALVLSSDPDNECRKSISNLLEHQDGSQVSSNKLPYLTHVIYSLANRKLGFQWADLKPGEELLTDERAIWNDTKSNVMLKLTSGSTGRSKMIVTHARTTIVCMKMVWIMSSKSKSGCITCYPITWSLGFPDYFLATGLKQVYIDGRTSRGNEELVYNTIVQEKCDFSVMSAVLLLPLVEIEKTTRRWSLQECIIGGYPLTKATVDAILQQLNTIYNYYGSSEAGAISFKPIEKSTEFEDFNTGTPIADTQVKIVDENNQPVQEGETGSILVKSPHMFSRYLNDKELTKAAFTEDDFFKTGDVGYFNKDGELIMYGRVSEVIMRGETVFHPALVQKVIKTCPGVADVMVVKVPDGRLYHEICASVVLEPDSNQDEKTIMDFCREKFMTDEWGACPKYIIILDRIPLNSNSKPGRLATEKYAAEYLNL